MKVQSCVIPFENNADNLKIIRSMRIRFYELLAGIVYFFLTKIFKYRKGVIQSNLRSCFPGISRQQESELTNAYYHHLSDLIVEPFLISHLKIKDIPNFVTYENTQLLNRFHRSGKDVLLMASHYGNWEYLFTLPLVTNYDVIAVYSPISNLILNRYMQKLRSRFGIRLITKSDWYRTILKEERQKPRLFIMLADQRPILPFKHSVDFLGQSTFVQRGCERIVQKLNCAVMYADVQKTDRHKYKFRFHLIRENNLNLKGGEILEEYYKGLEKTIMRDTSCWLWSHDRWKNHLSENN